MVCKLNTRCSILAACNVKGEIEDGKSISANLALASPLLSRFDIIFLLLDRNRGDSWDSLLCDRILRGRGYEKTQSTSTTGQDEENTWDFDQLKVYVNYVRHGRNPEMSKISELVLSRYYQLQRRSDSLRCARTTVRLLESLVRLAQSHSKLMFHSKIQLEDSMMAVILMEASLSSGQTLESKIDLHASEMAPEVYKEWYDKVESEMLFKLGINKNNLTADDTEDEEMEAVVEDEDFNDLDFNDLTTTTTQL